MNHVVIYNRMKEVFDSFTMVHGHPRSKSSIEKLFGRIAKELEEESESEISLIRKANECKTTQAASSKDGAFTCNCPTCQKVKSSIASRIESESEQTSETSEVSETINSIPPEQESDMEKIFTVPEESPSVTIHIRNDRTGDIAIYHADSKDVEKVDMKEFTSLDIKAVYSIPLKKCKPIQAVESIKDMHLLDEFSWVVVISENPKKRMMLHDSISGSFIPCPADLSANCELTFSKATEEHPDVVNAAVELGVFPNMFGEIKNNPEAANKLNSYPNIRLEKFVFYKYEDIFDNYGITMDKFMEFLTTKTTTVY